MQDCVGGSILPRPLSHVPVWGGWGEAGGACALSQTCSPVHAEVGEGTGGPSSGGPQASLTSVSPKQWMTLQGGAPHPELKGPAPLFRVGQGTT